MFAGSRGIVVATTLLLFLPTPILSATSPVGALAAHDPIQILGDADFTAANGVTGGSGTPSDPYVIEGWSIMGGLSDAILLYETRAHFVIRNVSLDGAYYGVRLLRAANGTIEDSDVVGSEAIFVDASSRVTLSRNSLRGGPGIRLGGAVDVSLLGNTIESSYGDGILIESSSRVLVEGNHLRGGIRVVDSSFVTIEDNDNVPWDAQTGIDLFASTDATISGNDLGAGIWMFGDTLAHYGHRIASSNLVRGLPIRAYSGCADLTVSGLALGQLIIVDCTNVFLSQLRFEGSGEGILLAFVDVARMLDNTFAGSDTAIHVAYSTSVEVTGNEIVVGSRGIYVRSTDGLTIQTNRIVGPSRQESGISVEGTEIRIDGNEVIGTRVGISAQGAGQIEVTNNTLQGHVLGIEVVPDDHAWISNNTITDTDIGMRAYGRLVDAVGNTIIDASMSGIELLFCTVANVRGNSIAHATDGVLARWCSVGTVSANVITGGSTGVRFEDSTGGTVAENIVSNNLIGLSLLRTRGVTIHHNNFVRNQAHASDYEGGSVWDEGYPTGGNYWTGFEASDACSGPSQDVCPDPDGILDASRVIPYRGGVDRYPLAEPAPIGNTPPIASVDLEPISGMAGAFRANASETWDLETPAQDLQFRWDWEGDGTWDTGWTTRRVEEHTYTLPGLLSLRLEVRDSAGATHGDAFDLYVTLTPYTKHDRIRIDGDNFTAANGVTGGSGTAEDPFRIGGWWIDAAPWGDALVVSGSSAHVVVRDVYIHSVSAMYFGMSLGDLRNVSVERSVLFDAYTAISLSGVENASVEDTAILRSGSGVIVASSRDVLVAENLVAFGYGSGVSASDSSRVVVTGNAITGIRNPQVTGCAVCGTSLRDSLIVSNAIADNDWGVRLDGSTNVTIRENLVASNNAGVYLLGSSASRVYHNNFLGPAHGIPAADSTGTNVWDDGYPSGGNYWDGWLFEDQCSGPYQDVCTGPDGIGDTPYLYNALVDRYPLMFLYFAVNSPPVASFALTPETGDTTDVFVVDASGSADAEELAASLSFRWEWGDGSMTGWSAASEATHRFASPGLYTIRLDVRDSGGLIGSTTREATVVAPLSATAAADALTGEAPLTVRFAGSVSGGVPPYEIRWDFGDGTNSADEDPLHTYEEAGTYGLVFSAADSRGKSVERTLTVIVELAEDGSVGDRALDPLVVGTVVFAAAGAIGAGAWLAVRRSRRPK